MKILLISELLKGGYNDNTREEVIKQLRLLNNRLPSVIDCNKEISSGVQDVLRKYNDTGKSAAGLKIHVPFT